MKKIIEKFKTHFTPNQWLRAGVDEMKNYGVQLVYSSFLLFYAYQRRETPAWAKHIIVGALGYLIAPLDTIPDLTPLIGYTDDASVLLFALVNIACYITEDIRIKSKKKVQTIFPNYKETILQEVDAVL